MSSSAALADGKFRHEAFLYAGADEFVTGIAGFIDDAMTAGDAVLVAVTADKLKLLTAALGDDEDRVTYADIAEIGRNPARIISAWRDFAAEKCADGSQIRGVGEPIFTERGPAELVECQRHEVLLNLAFDDTPAWWLMCPYDVERLAPTVIDESLRSHPHVFHDGVHRRSAGYRGTTELAGHLREELPEPPIAPTSLSFEARDLGTVRHIVAGCGNEAGLDHRRMADLVIAIDEVATNSILHGGGRGTLRFWSHARSLVFEIKDRGHIDELLVGRQRPALGQHSGHGLWLVNELCDLVELRSSSAGTTVRLHMSLPAFTDC